jgi:ABC-type nitrate/sulfonate/bicarbonate transport system substrate-binding protein
LQAEGDVQLMNVGPSAVALEALRAGRVTAAIMTNPAGWQAEEAGFRRLGSLATELVDEWPQSVLIASERLIADDSASLRALLKAQVGVIRLMESDHAVAVDALVKYAKLEQRDAVRAFEDVAGRLNERGELPHKALPFFWEIAIESGDATEPWPESRYFDRRLVDSFAEWAPARS